MKKFFIALILISSILNVYVSMPIIAKNAQDINLVKKLCKPYKKPIKIVQGYSKKTNDIILNRKNKKYIVVEKVDSVSCGKYGYDKAGYYIKYNKTVPKKKRVISYLIYNPNTNYCDDILWIVDNKMYR